jgi:hypothetical protein
VQPGQAGDLRQQAQRQAGIGDHRARAERGQQGQHAVVDMLRGGGEEAERRGWGLRRDGLAGECGGQRGGDTFGWQIGGRGPLAGGQAVQQQGDQAGAGGGGPAQAAEALDAGVTEEVGPGFGVGVGRIVAERLAEVAHQRERRVDVEAVQPRQDGGQGVELGGQRRRDGGEGIGLRRGRQWLVEQGARVPHPDAGAGMARGKERAGGRPHHTTPALI